MEKERNRTQIKEQENSPEELNKREASNLLDTEFRVMIVRKFRA